MPKIQRTSHFPLIGKLFLSLISGIILGFYGVGLMPQFWHFGVIVCILVVALFVKIIRSPVGTYIYSALVLFFFHFLGIALTQLNDSSLNPNYFGWQETKTNTVFHAYVDAPVEQKENSIKCILRIEKVDQKKTVGRALVYFQKTEESEAIRLGDFLLLKANFFSIRANGNPKEFDYARYLKIHDIHHQAFVQKGNWAKVGHSANPIHESINNFHNYLRRALGQSSLSNENKMIAKALLLGEKGSLDRDTLRTYSSAGAMHVLAVSGLHVGIIMLIFSFFLKPLKRLKYGTTLYVILVLFIIWSYALITGFSASVLRASVMFSFVVIGKELERETSIYQSILVSAFILTLFDPYIIFQVGFQLSYTAVIGIVYLQPKIYNWFFFSAALPDKIWQITSVSIAAQMTTFPLGLYYFHQFPNFFFISNLIVIPMAFAILLVGMAYFFVLGIPYLNRGIEYVLDGLIGILNSGVKWVESLPYSIYWGVSIQWYEVFWLYTILVAIVVSFVRQNKRLLYLSFILIIGLLMINVGEQYGQHHKKELVIYNINKCTGIDLFYGRQNIFIGDESLIEDEEKLIFHVKHNWYFKTGQEEATKAIALKNQKEINVGDIQLKLVSSQNMNGIIEPTASTNHTIVYLFDIDYLGAEIVEFMVESNVKIIIGPRVGKKLLGYLKYRVPSDKLHVLKEDGAFQQVF